MAKRKIYGFKETKLFQKWLMAFFRAFIKKNRKSFMVDNKQILAIYPNLSFSMCHQDYSGIPNDS